jgi:hypothetical protein
MIDDTPRTPCTDPATASPPDTVTGDPCANAITELVRLILELTSMNAAVDYAKGARIREELEHALHQARQDFEALPEGAARAEALRRLEGLRIVANRQLAIGPTPSASAIAAASGGDWSVWLREADAWVAERRGHGSSPPRRRPHSDTRPDSPRALLAEAVDPRSPTGQRPVEPAEPPSSADGGGHEHRP